MNFFDDPFATRTDDVKSPGEQSKSRAGKTRVRRRAKKMTRQSHGRNRVMEERAEAAANRAVCQARIARSNAEDAREFWESREERGFPMPKERNRNQFGAFKDDRPSVMDTHETYVWCADDPTVKRSYPPSADEVTTTIPTQA